MLPTLRPLRRNGARIALPAFYLRGRMESDACMVNDVGPYLSTNFGDDVPGVRWSIVRKRDSRAYGVPRFRVGRSGVMGLKADALVSSGLHQLNCTHTTALRGFRLGAGRAVVCVHHKRRATTSGSLATPPFGSLFPSPRGVGKACRWAAIARASPPAEETGKAIVCVQFS